MLSDRYARAAAGIAARYGAPYYDARLRFSTPAIYDDGGSIAVPGEPGFAPCRVQVDVATEAMRASEGFTERDVRLLVLGLDRAVTTDMTVEVMVGPGAGTYSVQAAVRDPAGIGWAIEGRRT